MEGEKVSSLCSPCYSPSLRALPMQISPPWGYPCSLSFFPACKGNSRLKEVSCHVRNTRPLVHREGQTFSTSGWNLPTASPGLYAGSKVIQKKNKRMALLLHHCFAISRSIQANRKQYAAKYYRPKLIMTLLHSLYKWTQQSFICVKIGAIASLSLLAGSSSEFSSPSTKDCIFEGK